jgi:hypothetical protein
MWPTENFWTFVPLSLDEVQRLLGSAFLIRSEFGDENRWEWFEGKDVRGRSWNVSRRWGADLVLAKELLRIVIVPLPDRPEELARELSVALKAKIHFGAFRYLRGDEFLLEEQFHIEPRNA